MSLCLGLQGSRGSFAASLVPASGREQSHSPSAMRAGVNESLCALSSAGWASSSTAAEFAFWHKPKFTKTSIAPTSFLGAG